MTIPACLPWQATAANPRRLKNPNMLTDDFLLALAERLRHVGGVQAVVLGGSRARGTAQADSDYDIGLYFDTAAGFDLNALNVVARDVDDEHREALCTPVGGWGTWVVGGGWLRISGGAVDFIYRELPVVRTFVADCLAGRIVVGYQPGHPFGFVSSIYAGEAATCRVLWERDGVLTDLKTRLTPYPPPLARAIIDKFLFEAGFCLDIAAKPARRGDIPYVAGALYRGAMCLTQVVFALNDQWWLNEKGAVALTASFARAPANYAARVGAMFACDPVRGIETLTQLNVEVGALV